jgi:hypothetical protein
LKKTPAVGLTDLEKQSERRKSFFSDHKKVIGLEEECMLLEYYLKDEEREKAKLNYLKGLEQTSHHRRLTPNTLQNHQLYATHD